METMSPLGKEILSYFRLHENLPSDEKNYIKNMKSFALNDANFHNYLYSALSILDSKAGTLLSYNSVMIAILAFLYKKIIYSIIITDILVIIFLSSSFILLTIIRVFWSVPSDRNEPLIMEVELVRHRQERTIRYRLSWLLSAFATFGLNVNIVFYLLSELN